MLRSPPMEWSGSFGVCNWFLSFPEQRRGTAYAIETKKRNTMNHFVFKLSLIYIRKRKILIILYLDYHFLKREGMSLAHNERKFAVSELVIDRLSTTGVLWSDEVTAFLLSPLVVHILVTLLLLIFLKSPAAFLNDRLWEKWKQLVLHSVCKEWESSIVNHSKLQQRGNREREQRQQTSAQRGKISSLTIRCSKDGLVPGTT